jgi:HSP20 family protein
MSPLARWNQSRWNLLNEVEDLRQSLRSLSSRSCAHWPEEPLRGPQRIPLVAVRENARGYVLKAELPQVKQEDVKLNLDGDTLTITGDREFNLNRKKGQPAEHACGRFTHSFEIPADARPAKVSGVFKNGVLMVHLGKSSVSISRPGLASCSFPTLRLNCGSQFDEPNQELKS